jgi:hypothetical protein
VRQWRARRQFAGQDLRAQPAVRVVRGQTGTPGRERRPACSFIARGGRWIPRSHANCRRGWRDDRAAGWHGWLTARAAAINLILITYN